MSLLPQFGFLELLLVGALALIVVGPKDLPRLMRSAGQAVAQARRMASEFTAAFDQMARETEMEEMRKEIDALKNDNVFVEAKETFKEATKPLKEAVDAEASAVKRAVEDSNHPEQTRAASISNLSEAPSTETKAPETKVPETKATDPKTPSENKAGGVT
ncbi:MAG: Sec-independent protein translocase protein TatB [Pseudomonadota bacterium]